MTIKTPLGAKLKAYLFWYKSTATCPTTYIWIFAYTKEQAIKLYKHYGYNEGYDFENCPCGIRENYNLEHKYGDIYGYYARI